jgi:lysophospholipase L1-like esterase
VSEWSKRLALLAAALLVSLGGGEMLLRIVAWHPDRVTALRAQLLADLHGLHVTRPDRPWLYGLRPGAEATIGAAHDIRYVVNADGFRDRLRVRPKPEGTFRVVVLGDSIAFGLGVPTEATFPAQLEQRLVATAPERHPEVLNLGVSGYNPYNESMLFADVGVTYQPDLVLQQFCANDLNDPTLHFDASTQLALGAIPDLAYPDPSRRRPRPSFGVRLCQQLRICGVLSELLFHAAPGAPTARELDAAFQPPDPHGPELAWLQARYAETAALAAARGARYAVVVFPDARHLGKVPAPVYERIAALGRAGGWLTIDLLPAFKRAAASGERVLVDDWHPTPLGNRIAAETIFRELACHGWLPDVPREACGS